MNRAEAEAALLAAYRAANPSSRATGLCRYTRNGGTAKQRGCILCGAKCPGWSSKWPRTQQSLLWEVEHVAAHADEWLARCGINTFTPGESP